MSAAGYMKIKIANAAYDEPILCTRRFFSRLDRPVVFCPLTIWYAEQADGVYRAAGIDAVFEMLHHTPPQVGTSTYSNIKIKNKARVVEEEKWSGVKKPKPGEKKPEQKPDKKKPKPGREGDREPREPRQPNRYVSTLTSFLFAW